MLMVTAAGLTCAAAFLRGAVGKRCRWPSAVGGLRRAPAACHLLVRCAGLWCQSFNAFGQVWAAAQARTRAVRRRATEPNLALFPCWSPLTHIRILATCTTAMAAAPQDCPTRSISNCGYRLGTRVYRARMSADASLLPLVRVLACAGVSLGCGEGGGGVVASPCPPREGKSPRSVHGVLRAVLPPLHAVQPGAVGTVACAYFTTSNGVVPRDGVCFDNWVQGTSNDYACERGCSPHKCHEDGLQFVACDDLECIDGNGNGVCDSEEGIPC
jgi:hypothetical protein